ncbi:hypothetical protein FQN54_005674 [Arachnomyces sp. PD_36]|nr:hypothetical protein FQN54_005674 [Arachnomyces sp. PD_36]
MSSGFVSGGTVDEPKERDAEWLKAQQELEEARRRKIEERKQDGGKSLYEILQQNKNAKQEAFEESIRLKNQFRSLDEDEVEFLDSVLESTRSQEAAIKKETNEQLELFHRQRQEADQALLDTSKDGKNADSNARAGSPVEEEHWTTTNRKRRRAKEKEAFRGVKLRKSSSSGRQPSPSQDSKTSGIGNADTGTTTSTRKPSTADKPPTPDTVQRNENKADSPGASASGPKKPPVTPAPLGLGLGAYSSDED